VADEVPSAFAPLTDKAPVVTRRVVLAQTSQDATDERYPILVYEGGVFHNFQFSTRFKLVSGVAEQMAGVVFRFQNVSNFYVARVSALGRNVRFYKVVNGLRADPIGPQVEIGAGVWHTLAVQCEGNQIKLLLDDRLVMPALGDNSFAEGKIGFWTKSDSVSYFADAVVTYTPRIPGAQLLVNSVMQQEPRILGLRIYTLATNGLPRVLASKEAAEIGQPGTDAEAAAIREGTVSFGRERGAVLVTLPLHDRNGDPRHEHCEADADALHLRRGSVGLKSAGLQCRLNRSYDFGFAGVAGTGTGAWITGMSSVCIRSVPPVTSTSPVSLTVRRGRLLK